jgi:hypothetical protein
MRAIEEINLARAREMFDDNLTIRDVADELGISKSNASRLKKKIEDRGRGQAPMASTRRILYPREPPDRLAWREAGFGHDCPLCFATQPY